jgi:Spy/CpxP family protein refolding chaperone
VVVLLLVNTAVLAMLWFKKPPQGPPPGGSAKDFLIKELNLSADQQKKFDGLREEHQKQTRDIMEGMKDLKDALVDKISSPENDTTGINDLTSQIADKERRRDIATVNHFRSFRTILNADQQKKFDKILRQVMRMMSGQQRPPQGPPPHERERGDRPPGDSNEMPPPPGEGHEPR